MADSCTREAIFAQAGADQLLWAQIPSVEAPGVRIAASIVLLPDALGFRDFSPPAVDGPPSVVLRI